MSYPTDPMSNIIKELASNFSPMEAIDEGIDEETTPTSSSTIIVALPIRGTIRNFNTGKFKPRPTTIEEARDLLEDKAKAPKLTTEVALGAIRPSPNPKPAVATDSGNDKLTILATATGAKREKAA